MPKGKEKYYDPDTNRLYTLSYVPDWKTRFKYLKITFSLLSDKRKKNIARMLKDEYGWTDKRLAREISTASRECPYKIVRDSARKKRWDILKRDNFTCQYCGASAPEVELQVDHMKPVSKGGESDDDNLITACVDCNQGKFDDEVVL